MYGPAPSLVRTMCCSTLGCGSGMLLALDAAKDAERQQSCVRGTVTFSFFILDLTHTHPPHPPPLPTGRTPLPSMEGRCCPPAACLPWGPWMEA